MTAFYSSTTSSMAFSTELCIQITGDINRQSSFTRSLHCFYASIVLHCCVCDYEFMSSNRKTKCSLHLHRDYHHCSRTAHLIKFIDRIVSASPRFYLVFFPRNLCSIVLNATIKRDIMRHKRLSTQTSELVADTG